MDHQRRYSSQEHAMRVVPKESELFLLSSMSAPEPLAQPKINVPESALNCDFAVRTYFPSERVSRFSEPVSGQTPSSSTSWRLGMSQICVLSTSQSHSDQASPYHFLPNEDAMLGLQCVHDFDPAWSGLSFSHNALDQQPRRVFPASCHEFATNSAFSLNNAVIGPSSPALTDTSNQSFELLSSTSTTSPMSHPALHEDEVDNDVGDFEEGENSKTPYSLLIYQALTSSPGNKLSLQAIYAWFQKNTNKGKDPHFKGWQNSIRHNLSMNAAFIQATKEPTKKKSNVWQLSDDAITHGVQSTTRYRKPGNQKKSVRSENPSPQRQRSGAKGGRATKVSARHRRASLDEHYANRSRLLSRYGLTRQRQVLNRNRTVPASCTPVLGLTEPIRLPSSTPVFGLQNVVGCTDLPNTFVYYDPGRRP